MKNIYRLLLGVGIVAPFAGVAVACGSANNDDTSADKDTVDTIKNFIAESVSTEPRDWATIDDSLTEGDNWKELSESTIGEIGINLTWPSDLGGASISYKLKDSDDNRIVGTTVKYSLDFKIQKNKTSVTHTYNFESIDKYFVLQDGKHTVEEIHAEIGEIKQISKKLMSVYNKHKVETNSKETLFTSAINTELGLDVKIPSDLKGVKLDYVLSPKKMVTGSAAEYDFYLNISIPGIWGVTTTTVITSSDNYNPAHDMDDIDEMIDGFGDIKAPTNLTYEKLAEVSKYSQSRYTLNELILQDLNMPNKIDWKITIKGVRVEYTLIPVESTKVPGGNVDFELTIWFSKNGAVVEKKVTITSTDKFDEVAQSDQDDIDEIKGYVGRANKLNKNTRAQLEQLVTKDAVFNQAAITTLGIEVNLPSNLKGVSMKYSLSEADYSDYPYDKYDLTVEFTKGTSKDVLELSMYARERNVNITQEAKDIQKFKEGVGTITSKNTKSVAALDRLTRLWGLKDNDRELKTNDFTPWQVIYGAENPLDVLHPDGTGEKFWQDMHTYGVSARLELQPISKVAGQKAKYMLTIHLSKYVKNDWNQVISIEKDKMYVEITSSDNVEPENPLLTQETNRIKGMLTNGKAKTSFKDADLWMPSDIVLSELTGKNTITGWKNHVAGTFGHFTINPKNRGDDSKGELNVLYQVYPSTDTPGSIQVTEITLTGFLTSAEWDMEDDMAELGNYYRDHLSWGSKQLFIRSKDRFAADLDALSGRKIHRYDLGDVVTSWNYPPVLSSYVTYQVKKLEDGQRGAAYEVTVEITEGNLTDSFKFVLLSKDFIWPNDGI